MAKWILLLCFHLVFSQNYTNYPCPKECTCTINQDFEEEFVFVKCVFEFIGENITIFSVLETNVTSVLQVECNPYHYSELADKMFQNLYSFKAILFQSCGFNYVPEHAFYGLRNLKKLQINEASNLKIHQHAFVNTPILQQLIIVSSGLSSLKSARMPLNLQFVNFTNNKIKTLSDSGMFDEDKIFYDMRFFILNKNRIAKLDRNFNRTLPSLLHISLEENMISHVIADSFRNLTNLKYADFTGNYLSILPVSLLSDAVNLKALGLGFNPISVIPFGFLNTIKLLEVLDLHQTNIDDAVWSNVERQSSLRELQLGENRITSITENNLKELKMLLYLNISSNNISEIRNNTFINQHLMKVLNLDHNYICVIESRGFKGLQSLQMLRLHENKLSFIHQDIFKSMPHLLLLNLSYNFLEYFPPVSYLHNLVVLDLRCNNISWINRTSFQGLNSLAGINLSYNKIKVLTCDMFQTVPLLRMLVLSFNDISVIETSTFNKLSLKEIYLDNNKINDISDVFQEMPNLLDLELQHNKIQGTLYTKYFRKLTSLQKLVLSFNYISSIQSGAFDAFNFLSIVDLRHNKISSITPRSLMFSEFVTRPPIFYFVGNNFLCDCNLAWMRECLDKWIGWCRALDINEFEILHCYRGYKIKPFSLIKIININNMMCVYNMTCDRPCSCCNSLDLECHCRVPCPENCSCWRSFDRNYNVIDCTNQTLMEINQTIPTIANKLYLDGNNFTLLRARLFQKLYELEVLYLNNSGIRTIETGSFAFLSKLKVLYLNDNMLQVVLSTTLEGLVSLEYLNLENNMVMKIEKHTFDSTQRLKTLCFAKNYLTSLYVHLFDSIVNLEYMSMAENPWSCDCKVLEDLITITYKFADIIKDRHDIYCYINNTNNHTLTAGTRLNVVDLDMSYLCPNDTIIYRNTTVEKLSTVLDYIYIKTLIATLITLAVFFVITVVIVVNRQLMQVLLFNKFGIRFCHEKREEDKQYDAFVSYSHQDENFIVQELLPKLERDEGYNLCVHFRDFPVGASIADTIIESVENSRRTIMVVSNNFLDSEWCNFEFKTAHHQVLRDKASKIILILMENVDHLKLGPELKLYMKTKTYLKRQDPWFWEKIVYAMPEITPNENTRLIDFKLSRKQKQKAMLVELADKYHE